MWQETIIILLHWEIIKDQVFLLKSVIHIEFKVS